MKTLLMCLLVFISSNALWAKKTELTLKECKNWNNFQTLDSVVVYFTAKNRHLQFRQSFQVVNGVLGSNLVTLTQREKDLEHFKSALLIMTTAISLALPDNENPGQQIIENKHGLASSIFFDQHLEAAAAWKKMYDIFNWANFWGKTKEIKVQVYTHN